MNRVVRGSATLVVIASLITGTDVQPSSAQVDPRSRVLASASTPAPTVAPATPTPPAVSEEFVEVEDGHTGEIVRIPASELAPPPVPTPEDEAALRAEAGMPPRDVQPRRWASGSTRCSRYGRFRYCDGPLRVPEPVGPEADLGRRLGLGSHTVGGIALEHEPRSTWLAEVRGLPFDERLLWPVDGGSFVRGLKPDRRVRVVIRRRGRRITRFVTKPGHNGVDIAARPGTHVFAVETGLVVYSRNEMRGYGNVVVVLHSNGSISLYSHLRAAWVFPGQMVARGQTLGEVGETGLARGPHLHFEWRRNGVPLNPVPRFTRRPARPGEPEPPPLDLPEETPDEPDEEETIEVDDESELAPESL